MEPIQNLGYGVGDPVSHHGDNVTTWKVEEIFYGDAIIWVRARHAGTSKVFPSQTLTLANITQVLPDKASRVVKSKVKPKSHKKHSAGDAVAMLLAEAPDIAGCWKIAEMAGIDVVALSLKIGHLSNGLQKMNISNRLRKMHSAGKFDPTSIIWTAYDGFVQDSIDDDFNLE